MKSLNKYTKYTYDRKNKYTKMECLGWFHWELVLFMWDFSAGQNNTYFAV